MTPVTKRMVPAHILVCNGCCCGQTQKGHPPVPLDWLKQEFKARKLLRKVHLTIAGCLGPCDTPNVICINFATGTRWFGNLTHFWQYEAILDWASASAEAGSLLPLPAFLVDHEMDVLLPANPPGTPFGNPIIEEGQLSGPLPGHRQSNRPA